MRNSFASLLGLSVLFFFTRLNAQVNTPSTGTYAPAVPFGALINATANPYGNGMVPGNLPGGTYNPSSNLYGKSQDAYTYYNTWKAFYRNGCGGTPASASIKTETAGKTYSESIGYAMLLAVYAADKAFFDELWQFYKNNRNCRGLMGWRRDVCSTTGGSGSGGDDNGATDGDLDAAMALVAATCQWPAATGSNTTTDPHHYRNDALALLDAIRKYEIDYVTTPVNQISNGDGWLGYGNNCNPSNLGNGCRNPGYMGTGYLRQFASFQPAQATVWNNVLSATNTLLLANRHGTTGFISSWSSTAGTANTCNGPNEYGYDACRSPWRMATDVLWYGPATATVGADICTKISTFLNGKTATMAGPVPQSGSPFGPDHVGAFVGPWAVGAMGATVNATNQAHLDACYTVTKGLSEAVDAAHYFSNTLKCISLFVMTGNFWKASPSCPTLAAPANCKTPDLGSDLNTCTGTTLPAILNANAGASGGSISYKWYTWNGTTATVIPGQTSQTYSANAVGGYIVERDSTATPTCSRYDTIFITNVLTKPSLGPDQNLCTTGSVTFSAGNAASFPGGTTWQWQSAAAVGGPYSNIGGETTSSITVSTVAYYKLIATSGACSNSDTAFTTSFLTKPALGSDVNLCNPASVNLAASNAGSFPGGTTWQWQSASVLAGPYTVITGQTSSTYSFVRTPNYYKLIATSGSCSNSDTIRVTSSNPTPGDVCGSGTVTLTISNAGTGPYNWYDASSTLKCASATSCAIASPTTLYVQDMGTMRDSVGPQNRLTAGGYTSKGGTTQRLIFKTNNNNTKIDTITVFVTTYAVTNLDFTVKIFQSDAVTQVGSTANPPTIVNYPNLSGSSWAAVKVPVGITVPTAGAGYQLEVIMSAGSNGNMWYAQSVSPPWASYVGTPNNLVDITGNYNQANDYSFAYNWKVSTGGGGGCARLPVVASNTGCSTSPVELFSFYAEERKGDVALLWATASESNNDYFEVQRSSDGTGFSTIGKVQGHGNSNSIEYYEFADEYPDFGTSYYRLKQVDFDGTTTFSEVISVIRHDHTSLNVAPNPFSNETLINVFSPNQEKISLKIIDLSGKEVYSESHATNENIAVGAGLPCGVYIIRVLSGDRIYHSKMVKN